MWREVLTQFSRRPVAVFLMLGTLVFLGLFSWQQLPIDLLPSLNIPYAVVVTPYIGATPQEVERNVTGPLESAISFVSGVKSISSQSRDGFSVITIEFESDTDMGYALSKVKESIDSMAIGLAKAVDPIIVEFNPSLIPVYVLGLSADDPSELKTMANELRGILSRIEGVANVNLTGIPQQEVAIVLDDRRMNELEIPIEIVKAVLSDGVRYPMGLLEDSGKVYTLSVKCDFDSVEELANTVIGFRGMGSTMSALSQEMGQMIVLEGIPIPVRLNQIATVELVDKELRGTIKVDGASAAVLTVQKQSGANTVRVASEIQKNITRWRDLSPDNRVIVITDTSQFTSMSINSLFRNLLVGALVATLVIFFFLRNVVATVAIAVSMPLSLLIAIMLMNFSGLGLDLMTLGGLTMAIGMIVDNSIVVLEAIFRYLESKKDPYEAAGRGAEVVGAIFASTLTTIAVFVPFAFISGFAAQFFGYFALALAFSLGASLFLAVVMIPAFTQFIKVKRAKRTIDLKYGTFLNFLLDHKPATLIIFVCLFAISLLGLISKDTEFIPSFDSGIINVDLTLPQNISYKTTSQVAEEINREILNRFEELDLQTLYSSSGDTGGVIALVMGSAENKANIQVILKPLNERRINTEEVAGIIRVLLETVAERHDARIDVGTSGLEIEAVFGRDIEIAVFENDLDNLRAKVEIVASKLSKVEGIKNLETSFDDLQNVLELTVDRSKATLAGLYHMQVLGVIQPYTMGVDLGIMSVEGQSIPVKLYKERKEGYEWLKSLSIDTLLGSKTYVGIVSSLDIKGSPVSIEHFNGQRVGYIRADTVNRPLGSVVEEIKVVLGQELEMGSRLMGQGELIRQTIEQFGFALLAGIIFMYLIIGAQFESLVYPLVIFLTLPMSLVGVMVVVYLFDLTINISSLVGILTLAGVTVNNGIVMITQINQLREKGLEKRRAILEGTGRRIRPILMTSLTTVVALLPTAFAKYEGSELESPLALVIAGGLLIGTAFTLFLTPVLYDIIDRISSRFDSSSEGLECDE